VSATRQAHKRAIKFAAISASSSGNNTIVAAVTDKRIRVLSAFLVAAGAVTAKFQSGASGTDLTGAASLSANGGYVLPFNEGGWFQTDPGTLLNLSLGGAQSVAGSVSYIEEVGN
jgi:hypothetical protein